MEISIYGNKYKLSIDPSKTDIDKKSMGIIDYAKRIISVMEHPDWLAIFFHEIAHGYLWHSGNTDGYKIEDKEVMCDRFGHWIEQFIKDNGYDIIKKVIDFYYKETTKEK